MKAKADLVAKYKAGQPGQQGNPVYAAMLESRTTPSAAS